MSQPEDRPTIDERYTSATHASSLVVTAERGGAADMLIAAGWSPSRLGASLLRLVSEWDGAEKPRPMHARGINILATEIAREHGRDPTEKPRFRKAADWALNLLMRKS